IGSMDGSREPGEFVAEVVETFSGSRADGENGRVAEKRVAGHGSEISSNFSQMVSVDRVGFCNRDDALGDAQQLADGEMLDGLRLDAFVGGNHEQNGGNAAGAREHGADEEAVPRDVDEADA